MNCQLITLVPATEDDYEFSYQVKKAAEGEYIKTIWGWDEALQKDFHGRDWKDKRPHIIKYDGRPIGTLSVKQDDRCIQIGQFFILPEYQNKGIGSYLLRRVLEKADQEGLVSKLAFLKGNRVESLYRRNGFRLVSMSSTHCFMERKPH